MGYNASDQWLPCVCAGHYLAATHQGTDPLIGFLHCAVLYKESHRRLRGLFFSPPWLVNGGTVIVTIRPFDAAIAGGNSLWLIQHENWPNESKRAYAAKIKSLLSLPDALCVMLNWRISSSVETRATLGHMLRFGV